MTHNPYTENIEVTPEQIEMTQEIAESDINNDAHVEQDPNQVESLLIHEGGRTWSLRRFGDSWSIIVTDNRGETHAMQGGLPSLKRAVAEVAAIKTAAEIQAKWDALVSQREKS